MDDYTSKPNTTGFVPVGGSADGMIEVETDGDWLRVDLLAGIAYEINVFGIGTNPIDDPRAQLRTADRVTLASDDNSGVGTAARITYVPTVSDSFFVQVSEVGRDDTGSYRVTLDEVGNPPPPPPPTDADIALTIGVTENGSFGNSFNGQSDADGIITASFENTGQNLNLFVKGFDIDFANEVQVRLNGNVIDFLSVGPNNELNSGDVFSIAASQQIAGTNTITFEQMLNDTYKWGVTDLLLQAAGSPPPPPPPTGADIALTIGVTENGSFGNSFNGQSDADGIITASFENTGQNLNLFVKGFDIDFANEVQVRLNGNVIDFLSVGPNNELNSGDVFSIAASQQIAGTNTITFEQMLNDTYKWGVTDLLLQAAGSPPPPPPPTGADIALTIGVTENGSFGNSFNGQSDADGIITASFENTGQNLNLFVKGFDIDFANEVQVRLNGNVIDFLSVGPNNELNSGNVFSIAASQQIAGTNTITFEQMLNDTYKWGVTDILLDEAGSPPPPPPPGDGTLDIMIIGDSFSIDRRGLPTQLEAALESRGHGDVEITNLSMSGQNIYGARNMVLDYFDDPAAEIPEVAMLAIGINDALAHREPSEIDRVLTRTINELKGEGVEVLLAVPESFFPLKSGEQGLSDPADQAAFSAVYDELAAENGLVIARDFIEGLTSDASLLEGDVFHPNPDGVARMVQNVLPELEQTIDRALPDSGGSQTASVNLDDIVATDGGVI